MKTRCKFRCDSITDNGDNFNAAFSVVYNGSPENKEFFKYTPGGQLTLNVVNNAVKFEVDKEYYLDLTEA